MPNSSISINTNNPAYQTALTRLRAIYSDLRPHIRLYFKMLKHNPTKAEQFRNAHPLLDLVIQAAEKISALQEP